MTSSHSVPLQALLIAPDQKMRRQILSGEKKITIRQGIRSYRPGPVMLCCHLVPWCVQAEITSVRRVLLRNVTDDDIAAEGCKDYEELKALLRRFYPGIGDDSPVTIIRWDKLSGRLVEPEARCRCGAPIVTERNARVCGGCGDFLFRCRCP